MRGQFRVEDNWYVGWEEEAPNFADKQILEEISSIVFGNGVSRGVVTCCRQDCRMSGLPPNMAKSDWIPISCWWTAKTGTKTCIAVLGSKYSSRWKTRLFRSGVRKNRAKNWPE